MNEHKKTAAFEFTVEELFETWTARLERLPEYWHDKLLPTVLGFLLMPLIITLFAKTTLIVCAVIFGAFAVLRMLTAPIMEKYESNGDSGGATEVRWSRSYVLTAIAYFSLLQLLVAGVLFHAFTKIVGVLPAGLAASVLTTVLVLGGVSVITVLLLPGLYIKSELGHLVFWLITPGNLWPDNMRTASRKAVMVLVATIAFFLLRFGREHGSPMLIMPLLVTFWVLTLATGVSDLHQLVLLAQER